MLPVDQDFEHGKGGHTSTSLPHNHPADEPPRYQFQTGLSKAGCVMSMQPPLGFTGGASPTTQVKSPIILKCNNHRHA